MSSNIVLGLATRQNLLSLQQINQNISTAQNHLSTGLKVSSAIDDAVKFFQSQSLLNRANDISLRKDSIDQGISSLTTATNAIQSVVTTLTQLQGLLNSAKTETNAQRKASATQFNSLATQLDNLVNDASYQGLNLVNSTKAALNLQFSIASNSTLKVTGVNLLVSKLISTGAKASVLATQIGALSKWSAVCANVSKFDAAFKVLQNSVFTAQADAQSIGGNVNFLQTRLDFSSQYIATLQGGSDKLIVADVNTESTNLVTLQTRQQLSIQSLSIATQSEQAVLRLFH
jgi:flagellin-like hook-associated protein FlgL